MPFLATLGAGSIGSYRTFREQLVKPENLVAPTVSGSTTVGSTLSTTNGSWTGNPTSYGYQWLRAGSPIGGATSSTYVTVSADVGNAITCRVTATNPAGSTNATSSNSITPVATYINASTVGASVSTSGNYRIATFTGSGTFTVNSLGVGSSESNTIRYLVVAGGGGGAVLGGGGAGGMKHITDQTQVVTVQTYTITVGGGGSANSSGSSSNIAPLVGASGGGFGGRMATPAAGSIKGGNGGSGGGGTGGGTPVWLGGGCGIPGEGNAGAQGQGFVPFAGKVNYIMGGGGGGAGTGGRSWGVGGVSGFSDISGANTAYAGGGGGGVGGSPPPAWLGNGGGGGGGQGVRFGPGATAAGTPNTGGGAGGCAWPKARTCGVASGGSGIVIIKWRFQ